MCICVRLESITAVGFGDIYPITTGGRLLTMIVILLGSIMMAIPITTIVSEYGNLVAESRIRRALAVHSITILPRKLGSDSRPLENLDVNIAAQSIWRFREELLRSRQVIFHCLKTIESAVDDDAAVWISSERIVLQACLALSASMNMCASTFKQESRL